MRMRHKKWARPELDACPYYIKDSEKYKGKWRSLFKFPERPLYIELGCGKGVFASKASLYYPKINWIALDIKSEVLAVGRRNIENDRKSTGKNYENIYLATDNISFISNAFSDEDSVDRIYINFCNPWPRVKHQKRRLTHPRQLLQYREFMKTDAEIHFKTDDDELFADSLEYFKECGFEETYITYDLHESGYEPNFETEHEKMFSDEGIKIKFLIAKKTENISPEVKEKYFITRKEEKENAENS